MEFSEKQIEEINKFSRGVNLCRSELTMCELNDEQTYFYAITRAYSRALLTACEICTLIRNGYPEGALSLARSLYEAMVMISKLLKGEKNNDSIMLERFFITPQLSQLQIDITTLEWVLKREPENKSASEALESRRSELTQLKKQHGVNKKIDYWWADANNFAELADNTSFPRDYMYARACANVHFNALGVFQYIDNSEEGILIGETDKGIELPLWYSTLTLYVIAGIIREVYPQLVSEKLIEALAEAAESSSSFYRTSYNVDSINQL